jgi:hypothetical protein
LLCDGGEKSDQTHSELFSVRTDAEDKVEIVYHRCLALLGFQSRNQTFEDHLLYLSGQFLLCLIYRVSVQGFGDQVEEVLET